MKRIHTREEEHVDESTLGHEVGGEVGHRLIGDHL